MFTRKLPSHPLCQGRSSVALIGNGTIRDFPLITSMVQRYDCIIAVDGGLEHCQMMNIVPDLIIGDLDSISQEVLNLYPEVPKEVFSIDKDHTDMELALYAANAPSVKSIGIFGAMEKRTDHALANLHLLSRFPEKTVIETERESIFLIKGTNHFPCYPGQVISLIPLGSSPQGVSTKGLKWELEAATLDKNFFSLSNICLSSQFQISIEQGDLLCCILRTH